MRRLENGDLRIHLFFIDSSLFLVCAWNFFLRDEVGGIGRTQGRRGFSVGESAPRSALEEPLACEVKESEGTKPWGPGAWQMVLKR